jgi:hypothetical protein
MSVRRLLRRSLSGVVDGVVARVPGSAALRAAAAWRYGDGRSSGERPEEGAAREGREDRDGSRAAAGVPPAPASDVLIKAERREATRAAVAGEIVGPARVEARHEVVYDWTYTTKKPELRALYEKSKDLMWNARTGLPWSTPVDPESELVSDAFNPIFGTDVWKKLDKKRDIPRLRQHMASYILSNFLHGEQGALLATAQLVETAPTTEAKMYAAAQVFDEARHVEAYDRYLTEKVELVYPPSPHLKQLLDTVLADSRWDFKLLGMQILIEGLALGAFGLIHQTAQEPLIKQLTQNIMQDEARHVAFGVMSLRGAYGEMSPSELREREDFVLESSRLLRDRFLAQEVWATVGLPQKECEDAASSSVMMQMFRKLLFSKIVPNVKRLGLLTPYVRRGFEELDVIEYESWEPSA